MLKKVTSPKKGVLALAALPPVLADAAAAAVLAFVALPPVLADAAAAVLPPHSLHWLHCRPCSHLTRFLFIGAAFAAAAGFSSGAAFSAAFAAAFAALSSTAFTANACVFSRYSNASPTSMSKTICADISLPCLTGFPNLPFSKPALSEFGLGRSVKGAWLCL
jgi:hypothetical protein